MNKSLMLTLFGGVMACAAVTGAGIVAQEYMDTDYVGAEAQKVDGTIKFQVRFLASTGVGAEWTMAVHHWIPNGAGTEWPGDRYTTVDLGIDDSEGHDIVGFDVTIPDGRQYVSVNNNDGGKQTPDLSLDYAKMLVGNADENVYVTIGGSDYKTVNWGVDRNVNEETFRFLIKRHKDETGGKLHTFHYWGDGTDVEIGASLWPQYNTSDINGNNWLAGFDVPMEAVGKSWQIKTYNEYTGAFEKATDTYTYQSGDNVGIHYVWDDGKTVATGELDAKPLKTDGGVIEAVLEARDTCSPSLDNGSGNAQGLYDYWFKNVDESVLRNTMIKDYASMDTDHDGGKVATVSALDKINAMKVEESNFASSSAAFLGLTEDQDKAVLAGSLFIGLAGIGAGVAAVYKRHRAGARD